MVISPSSSRSFEAVAHDPIALAGNEWAESAKAGNGTQRWRKGGNLRRPSQQELLHEGQASSPAFGLTRGVHALPRGRGTKGLERAAIPCPFHEKTGVGIEHKLAH